MTYPDRIETTEQLEDVMTMPCEELIASIARLDGDIMILGAGGKMGPTLARLALRAMDKAEIGKRVIAVSRFTEARALHKLKKIGVETIACDLLERSALDALPDVENIIFMAGRKFGSTGNEALTWAMNAYLPGMVMQRFARSHIVALSTGNVYPFTHVVSGGSLETDSLAPVGEYAQSCLGRERIIQYWSERNGTPVCIIRLNYAIDLRYGVLLDIAQRVWTRRPVDLRMSYVNVIWQGDANTAILMAFERCSQPPEVINMTGPEVISVRSVAERFAALLGTDARFDGVEQSTALLSNASRFHQEMLFKKLPLETMLQWTANWLIANGETLDKPTHFEERTGVF